MRTLAAPLLAGALALPAAMPTQAQAARPAPFVLVTAHRYGFDLRSSRAEPADALTHDARRMPWGPDVLSVRWRAPNIVEIHLLPSAHASAATLVLDPHRVPGHYAPERDQDAQGNLSEHSPSMRLQWNAATQALRIEDGSGRPLIALDGMEGMTNGRIRMTVNPADALYGLGGYSKSVHATEGMVRHGPWNVKAGEQGHPGAPWLWSTAGWGVLVDTLGAHVTIHAGRIEWRGMSRPDIRLYIVTGKPEALFDGLRTLSGPAPLFPKWSLGFINSQWGMDQPELLHIVRKYRALAIPLDAFSLDFDWKAWGKDHYGEFRWNTTKFPGGPDGSLKEQLDALGVHLIGIMKPRIHVHTVEGRYASAHDFWFPGLKAEPDYFSHKLVQDLDFDNPAVRAWFFNTTLQHSFETGIVGWWNDEADTTPDDTQFMNMERALYDGQRKYFPGTRVFSLNRDFYLGAQRYAYALWSGDIDTGFASMAAQRVRMLSAIDTGEMWWTMDGGGFNGHPSPENYARWMEFDAFSPIMRVHGTHDQRRQPWRYGATAEAAAVAAIRLRYRLLPYNYSYAWADAERGTGIVRPLPMAFPDDQAVKDDSSAWMFGDWLLVAPVMRQGQRQKQVLLPPGTWLDWSTGKSYTGSQVITVPVDWRTWKDIPIFVRDGAIIPMQPVQQYVHQRPVTQVTVQVFPAETGSSFEYYDDDGNDDAYAHGSYYLQQIDVHRVGTTVHLTISQPRGSYQPALRTYLFAVHGIAADALQNSGAPLPRLASLRRLESSVEPGWSTGRDRFGPVTYVRLASESGAHLTLESR